MRTPSFIPGGVAVALLVPATLPMGARARGAPAHHRHVGSARLGGLASGHVSVGGPSPSLGALRPADHGGPAPSLVALPTTPQVGERVQLIFRYAGADESSVAGGPRRIVWDLGGAQRESNPDVNANEISIVFATPGVHRVAVQLIGAASSQSRTLLIAVASRPLPPPSHMRVAARHRARVAARHRARVASDPPVGIADFHFTPTEITVHVGDTVTWSNAGPSSHTATARDGSFDTGPIRRGTSASHTFTHAGTYAYFCSIHPFMHGTVTVLTAATSPPRTSSSPSISARPSTAASPTPQPDAVATAQSGSMLPNTGLPVDEEVGVGVGLVALGLLTRRQRSGHRAPRASGKA